MVGSAGFIGYHLTYTLKARGIDVDGVDYLDEKKYPVLIKQKRVWDLLLSHHINVKHVDICEHTEALHQGVLYSHIIYLGASDEFRTHDKPSNSGCFVNLLDKLRKLNGSSRPILLTTGVSIQDCVDSIRCSPHNFNSKLIPELNVTESCVNRTFEVLFSLSTSGMVPKFSSKYVLNTDSTRIRSSLNFLL